MRIHSYLTVALLAAAVVGCGEDQAGFAYLKITPSPSNIIGKEIKAGASFDAVEFELQAVGRPVMVSATPLGILSLSGDSAYVKGSRGRSYFRNMRYMDAANRSILAGPLELPDVSPLGNVLAMYAADAFTIPVNGTLKVVLAVDTSSEEDAPFEFIGNVYRLVAGDSAEGFLFAEDTVCFADGACPGQGQGSASPSVPIVGNHMIQSTVQITN